MHLRRIAALACACSALLLAAACSNNGSSGSSGSPSPSALAASIEQYRAQYRGPNVSVSICDWVASYDDIPSMAKDADIIIVGSVAESSQQTDSAHLAFTTSDIVVTRALKGNVATGQHISVLQTDGCRGDPIIAKDIIYLLFLQRGPGGTYAVPGGPDGRFVVENGMIEALNVAYQDDSFGDTGISGLTLDQVAKKIG